MIWDQNYLFLFKLHIEKITFQAKTCIKKLPSPTRPRAQEELFNEKIGGRKTPYKCCTIFLGINCMVWPKEWIKPPV
jgi:hypothetical protein